MQAVVNPSDEALWNLLTASSNQHELNVVDVLASSDTVLPQVAARLACAVPPLPPRGPRKAAPADGGAQPGDAALDEKQQQQAALAEEPQQQQKGKTDGVEGVPAEPGAPEPEELAAGKQEAASDGQVQVVLGR